MDVRLSYHAWQRAEEFGLSRADIQRIIEHPSRHRRGQTAVEADGEVRGRSWRVVYTDKQEFILVITVHPIEDDQQ